MSENASNSLVLKVQTMLSSLAPSERRVAEYICAHPDEVIRQSVAGLAEASRSSEATVIRASRHLGFNGFQDLKIHLAQSIVSPLQAIHEDITEFDSAETIIDKVFQGNLHTLTFTRETLSVADMRKAADAIAAAESVSILGVGNSNSSAIDFQHKLMRLGIRSFSYSDSHMSVIAMTSLRPTDVVVALSHSGSTKDIVESVKIAKKRGAFIISITSLGASPLSKVSDIALHTASEETRYRIVSLSSRIAQLAIIDSLYTLIAAKDIERNVEHFHELEDALKEKKY